MKRHLPSCYSTFNKNVNPKQLQCALRNFWQNTWSYFFSLAKCLFFKRLDNWHSALNCCFTISKHLLTYCRILQKLGNSLPCVSLSQSRNLFCSSRTIVRPFKFNQVTTSQSCSFQLIQSRISSLNKTPAICFQHKAKVCSFILRISHEASPSLLPEF